MFKTKHKNSMQPDFGELMRRVEKITQDRSQTLPLKP